MLVALTAMNAALYCAGSLATAYIPTGVIIQLRPAVLIPALFAALFGPWVGGLGAAMGTFIASIMRYGTPILTLASGTPGNFACYYVLGRLTWATTIRLRGRWVLGYLLGCLVGYAVGLGIIGVGLYLLALATIGGSTVGMPFLSQWLNPLTMFMGLVVVGFLPEFVVSFLAGVPIIKLVCAAYPNVPFNDIVKHSRQPS